MANAISVRSVIAAPIGTSGFRYRIAIVCVPAGTTNPWYAMFVAMSGAGSPSIVADQYRCPVTLATRNARPVETTSIVAVFAVSRTRVTGGGAGATGSAAMYATDGSAALRSTA